MLHFLETLYATFRIDQAYKKIQNILEISSAILICSGTLNENSGHFSLSLGQEESHIALKLKSFVGTHHRHHHQRHHHQMHHHMRHHHSCDHHDQGCSAEARVRRSLEKLNIPSWCIDDDCQ